MINFISKSSEFVQLVIGEKSFLPKFYRIFYQSLTCSLTCPQLVSLYLELIKRFVSSITLHHHWKLISIWNKPYVLLQLHEVTAFFITKYQFYIGYMPAITKAYLLHLYISCKRCMHMHFLFSPNPMKLGLIGMLSASLH